MKDRMTGKQTLRFANPPVIHSTYTLAGPLESKGPISPAFDRTVKDNMHGQKSFEMAEEAMMKDAIEGVLTKGAMHDYDMDLFVSTDLLDQIVVSNYTAATLPLPYIGLYSACTATALCLTTASVLIDGGYASKVLISTSSHHGTAERQYRYPTEYGNQKPPYSQVTATGAAAAIVSDSGNGPTVTFATVGRVIDTGIVDPANMGAVMAPAALDTIAQHFEDTGRGPGYYDLIATGDLGHYGSGLLKKLAMDSISLNLGENCIDCGAILYSLDQRVNSGGSGCATSALVVFSDLYHQLCNGTISKLLLVATGALHSPTLTHQGNPIPSVSHAVSIEYSRS